MIPSTNLPKQLIYSKICDVQADITAIGKDHQNKEQRYSFRAIDDIYQMIHELFVKHRIFSYPEVVETVSEERQSKTGSTLITRLAKVIYHFTAEDGSSIPVAVQGEGMDTGDKASNKALAAAHKYALLQLFTIPTGDKSDSEYESPEAVSESQPPKRAKSNAHASSTNNIAPSLVTELVDMVKEAKIPWPQFIEMCGAHGYESPSTQMTFKAYSEIRADVEKLLAKRTY